MSGCRVLLAGLAVVTAGLGGSVLSVAPAGAAAPAPCTGPIQITHLAFQPPAVAPGQSSTAHLAGRNCTNTTLQATLTWFGRFVGPSTGQIPPGCPVIDPVARSATLAPNASFTASQGYTVPASCTASELHVTAQFSVGGAVVAKRSANLNIIAP